MNKEINPKNRICNIIDAISKFRSPTRIPIRIYIVILVTDPKYDLTTLQILSYPGMSAMFFSSLVVAFLFFDFPSVSSLLTVYFVT